jgi:ABC-2 type transport system ATP-binding protein
MPQDDDATVFTMNGVTKRFGQTYALHDVTLSIPGGAVGLLGPNGAGKSTLIRIVLSLISPTNGTVTLLGSPDARPMLDKVGYMPEHDCLPLDMTAVGFVAYMGQMSGLDGDVALERTHDILDYVGLGEERYRQIKGFSTGMRQKVKFAQALVHEPSLVFFDEPTNGMDPQGRKEMLDMLRDVMSTGKSIVLSSHLLPDIEYVCDDVVILQDGRILMHDSLERLLDAKQVSVRIVGDQEGVLALLRGKGLSVEAQGSMLIIEGGVDARDIFEAAHRSNSHVSYLYPHAKRLEDVFLQAVSHHD